MSDWLERLRQGVPLSQIQKETEAAKAQEPDQETLEREHRAQIELFNRVEPDVLRTLHSQTKHLVDAFAQENPTQSIPGPLLWRYNTIKDVMQSRGIAPQPKTKQRKP